MTAWVNLGCGPFPAPDPWINLDVWGEGGNKPDVIVDPEFPLADFDGDISKLYCGHVIEHTPWDQVPALLKHVYDAMAPGGEAMFVAPDVYRTIQRYCKGQDPEGWDLIESMLESPWGVKLDGGVGSLRREAEWSGSRHHWNCWEARLLYAFEQQSPFANVRAVPIVESEFAGWPIVAMTQWQCAVKAVK